MIRRRDFLKALTTVTIGCGFAPFALATPTTKDHKHRPQTGQTPSQPYLRKIKYFDRRHGDDIFLKPQDLRVLKKALRRLFRVQQTVGFGNFYLLSFDDALKISRTHASISAFRTAEINFLEKLFYTDATGYGFYGKKPLNNLTDTLETARIVKVPNNHNYLYKGESLETYERIKKDVGDRAVLTSGLRGISKQFLLFLNKTLKSKGNVSMSSRSLAPPGYSYHGIGDFDIGQVGFGRANFSKRFTQTVVFKRLQTLDYISLRYPERNCLGVRFEPWHVEVVKDT
jgi:hypothetical protein